MKKYLLGAFAVVLAISFSAFTNVSSKNSKFITYYFRVSNSVTPGQEASATLTFPSSQPPTSVTSCSGSIHDCVLGFANAIQDTDGLWKPADASNNIITDYTQFTARALKL